jgi:hypothetical protein
MSDTQAAVPQAVVTTELLAALIQELKKPAPPSEQEVQKLKQEQAMRKQTAEDSIAIIEAKKREQRVCSHRRPNTSSRAVYVKNGNYFICQKCQIIVRPSDAPKTSSINTVYNTDLFNNMLQMSSNSNTMY